MVMQSNKQPERGTETRWLITFADLMSLLLTFFVMMFSMSSVNEETWKLLADTLSQKLNPARGHDETIKLTDRTVDTFASADGADLDYLYAVIAEKTRSDSLLKRAMLQHLDDRIVITLPSDLLFVADSAEITGMARYALGLMGDALRHVENRIDVNGYTHAGSPASDGDFSDWRLSIDQAVVVADALRRAGYDHPIVTLGRAVPETEAALESKPNSGIPPPIRRVDVVIRDTYGKAGTRGL